jgi:hypothetical protein
MIRLMTISRLVPDQEAADLITLAGQIAGRELAPRVSANQIQRVVISRHLARDGRNGRIHVRPVSEISILVI